jgi:hypothetical protein
MLKVVALNNPLVPLTVVGGGFPFFLTKEADLFF